MKQHCSGSRCDENICPLYIGSCFLLTAQQTVERMLLPRDIFLYRFPSSDLICPILHMCSIRIVCGAFSFNMVQTQTQRARLAFAMEGRNPTVPEGMEAMKFEINGNTVQAHFSGQPPSP